MLLNSANIRYVVIWRTSSKVSINVIAEARCNENDTVATARKLVKEANITPAMLDAGVNVRVYTREEYAELVRE